MPKARFTQRDVAQRAGVSQAAVSYVLNDLDTKAISPETRQRVLAAIEELGYVPDGVARGMRTGRSMLIGSVIPDITNPFYPAFQRGVQDIADTAGYSLVTFNSDGERSRELASIRAALQCKVDGLIVSLFETTSSDLDFVLAQDIPVVVYGEMTDTPDPLPYDLIDIDIVRAIGDVVTYLHERGHRSIAVVDGPALLARTTPRVDAYRAAMESRGLPVDERLILRTDFTEQGGYTAMEQVLRLDPRPTSVIAGNDVIAMGMLAMAEKAGVRVPDDIAVVGYDNIPASRLLRPALTTVALHPERIGARAIELLLDRLTGTAGDERRLEYLPHDLIIRDSA